MAWENRNGTSYYYRKRREGKRVVSEYVGRGLVGEIAATFDTCEKQDVEKKRMEFREQKVNAVAIDGRVNEIERYTRAFMRAALLVSGYHAPRRQWRKRRNVRE